MSEQRTLAPREQAGLLVRRYLAVLRGDWPTLLLLVGQAPLIGWLCSLVWGQVESDTPSLHFVLCLSALWFGCIAACREIVKERAILERERFFGLSPAAYVASKLVVLSGLGAVQVLLLQGAVEWSLSLRGNYLVETLALWGAAVAGVGLGLVVSALARRQDLAVGAVPLLLLPQILFSEFAVPEQAFGGVVGWIEKGMPVHWAYEVFARAAEADPSWTGVLLALLALSLFGPALGALAWLAVLPRREV